MVSLAPWAGLSPWLQKPTPQATFIFRKQTQEISLPATPVCHPLASFHE
jgi:hypothetical protein